MRFVNKIVIFSIVILLYSCATPGMSITNAKRTRPDVFEIRGRTLELASKNWLVNANYAKALQLLTAAATNYYHSETLADPTPYLRSMNAIAAILENITITIVERPESGFVQQAFNESIVISIRNNVAIQDMSFQIEYRQLLADKTTEVQTVILPTNNDGLLELSPPIPLASGQYRIMLTPYSEYVLDAANENFSTENPIHQDFIRKIRDMLDKKSITINIPIFSRASNFSTLTYVFETDIAGSPILSDATSTGIADTLIESGFEQISTIDQQQFTLSQLSDLSEYIEEQSISVDRIIYGTASIENFTESTGGFSVSVAGSVQVISNTSGRVLSRSQQKLRVDGATASGAIYNAFNTLGRRIAEMLLISMP